MADTGPRTHSLQWWGTFLGPCQPGHAQAVAGMEGGPRERQEGQGQAHPCPPSGLGPTLRLVREEEGDNHRDETELNIS